jgi:hypothetical protein
MSLIKRYGLWFAAMLLLLLSGYTAGYLLQPPESPPISRTLPELAPEAPLPQTPSDTMEET